MDKRDNSDQEKSMQKCSACGNMVNHQSDLATCPYCGAALK